MTLHLADQQTNRRAKAGGDPGGRLRTGIADRILMIGQPNGAAAESVRALRTNVVVQHFDRGRRALALCAPSAGVGCTLTSVNLAVALSQVGIRTLLVDADMHRPGVEGFLPTAQPQPGLAQCLTSAEVGFGDAIRNEVLPNLAVMYSGGATGDAQELLAGERFRALMDFCMREYDATVIDTPPSAKSSDATRISNVVGYSLVVAGKDVSYASDVETLIAQLRSADATVIGTVLTEA